MIMVGWNSYLRPYIMSTPYSASYPSNGKPVHKELRKSINQGNINHGTDHGMIILVAKTPKVRVKALQRRAELVAGEMQRLGDTLAGSVREMTTICINTSEFFPNLDRGFPLELAYANLLFWYMLTLFFSSTIVIITSGISLLIH